MPLKESKYSKLSLRATENFGLKVIYSPDLLIATDSIKSYAEIYFNYTLTLLNNPVYYWC